MASERLVEAPLRGRSVLVAEDEWVLAFDLVDLVEQWGGKVLGPFGAAGEAVDALCDGMPRPDLAVLDVRLADGTSAPVAERLLALGVPFAVATAYPAASLDSPALRAGRYLGKPVRHEVLLRAFEEMLRR